MRQPLEENSVTISRAMGSVTFPANVMLVAAMNPCPCGYRGDPKRQCNCSPAQIERYIGRISGPLLDRIDIHVEVPAVPFRELQDSSDGTNSDQMRERVEVARDVQLRRFADQPAMVNGKMSPRQIRQHCKLGTDAETLLKTAMEEMGLSARAHDRILQSLANDRGPGRCRYNRSEHLSEPSTIEPSTGTLLAVTHHDACSTWRLLSFAGRRDVPQSRLLRSVAAPIRKAFQSWFGNSNASQCDSF